MTLRPGDSILVLVNPISGRGRGARAAGRLARAFERHGLEARIVLLPGPGSARTLVRDMAPSYAAVAAVGGDGTVNEVAGALLAAGRRRPLGLVPLGLSNCLARHLNLPAEPEGAVAVIARGRLKKMDAALVGDRAVVSFLGAGFDAAVAFKVALARRGPIRNRDYIRAAARVFFSRDWPKIQVQVDGRRIEGRFFQVILCQITNYANYFRVPVRTGFNVYLFKGSGPAGLIRSLLRLGPRREMFRARDLDLPVRERLELYDPHGQARYQTDGEAGGRLPVDCQVKPGALNIFVP